MKWSDVPVIAIGLAVAGCSTVSEPGLDIRLDYDRTTASPSHPATFEVSVHNPTGSLVSWGRGSSSCQLGLVVRVEGRDVPAILDRPCTKDLQSHELGPGDSRTEQLVWAGRVAAADEGEAVALTAGTYEVRGVAGQVASSPLAVEVRQEMGEPSAPHDASILLPTIEGFVVDDDAEWGELASSLDHGAIDYEEIRRRLILDEDGYAVGEVTVVTFHDSANARSEYLNHRFGEAPRAPFELSSVEMVRIDTEPFAVLAWIGTNFVITFERGQSMSPARLRQLAEETIRAIGDASEPSGPVTGSNDSLDDHAAPDQTSSQNRPPPSDL